MRLSKSLSIAMLFGLIAINTSGCSGLTKAPLNPAPGQWRGLHLLNYRSDEALEGLEKDIPGLAGMY